MSRGYENIPIQLLLRSVKSLSHVLERDQLGIAKQCYFRGVQVFLQILICAQTGDIFYLLDQRISLA